MGGGEVDHSTLGDECAGGTALSASTGLPGRTVGGLGALARAQTARLRTWRRVVWDGGLRRGNRESVTRKLATKGANPAAGIGLCGWCWAWGGVAGILTAQKRSSSGGGRDAARVCGRSGEEVLRSCGGFNR